MTEPGAEELFRETILYARSAEKILAVASLLGLASTTLQEAHVVDPELLPELEVAARSLVDVGEALGRALTFLNMRLTVRAAVTPE